MSILRGIMWAFVIFLVASIVIEYLAPGEGQSVAVGSDAQDSDGLRDRVRRTLAFTIPWWWLMEIFYIRHAGIDLRVDLEEVASLKFESVYAFLFMPIVIDVAIVFVSAFVWIALQLLGYAILGRPASFSSESFDLVFLLLLWLAIVASAVVTFSPIVEAMNEHSIKGKIFGAGVLVFEVVGALFLIRDVLLLFFG